MYHNVHASTLAASGLFVDPKLYIVGLALVSVGFLAAYIAGKQK